MTDIVNGLAATRTRLALLRAIAYDAGRISTAPKEGDVWDGHSGMRVTARIKELIDAKWIRALAPNEPRGRGELSGRIYYRLTPIGRTALRGAR